MLQSHPRAFQDADGAAVVLEGDLQSVHGGICENNVPDDGWQHQKVELVVLYHPPPDALLFTTGGSSRHAAG